MAVSSGLDSAIMNPLDPWLMETLAASELLSGRDPRGSRFIGGAPGFFSSRQPSGPAADTPRSPEKNEAALLPEGPYRDLGTAILEGDGFRSGSLAGRLLDGGASPLSVVNEGVIPALEAVGGKYDRGEFFLPQLISSAEAARKAPSTSRSPPARRS